MLKSNAKIKKSVVSAFMCFIVLFTALSVGCCLRNSAVAVGDTILRDNEAEPEDDFPFWNTYAYDSDDTDNVYIPVAIIQVSQDQYIGVPCNIC